MAEDNTEGAVVVEHNGPAGVEEQGTFILGFSRNLGGPVVSVYEFPSVTHYMSDAELDETGFEWAYYLRMFHAFKVNLRRLFSELDFAGRVEDTPLLKAVNFLQAALRQGKTPRQIKSSEFPLAVIRPVGKAKLQTGGLVQELSVPGGQLKDGAAGGGEGQVPLRGIVPPRRLYRHKPHGGEPSSGALLQQARHG
jgi:hypothetical protein